MHAHRRREFLAEIGCGMLVAGVGSGVAFDMGLARAAAGDATAAKDRLSFGELEPLVTLMQETPADKLMPELVAKLKTGTELRTLIQAGALANARTFGGQDYIGYHTFMALAPALEMSRELPEAQQALPVLKVLYRNTARMQAQGGCEHETLRPIATATLPSDWRDKNLLREQVRARDGKQAEATFASMVAASPSDAYDQLQQEIDD